MGESQGSAGDAGDDDAQMQKIQAEKAALTRTMCLLIFLSLLVSGSFYGLTILENPELLPTRD